jgi:S1-C subfamily serine protease
MLKWIASHKYFEAALAIAAVMVIGGIGVYDYLHPTSMAREALVEQARMASVKVHIPSGGHGSGVVLTTDGRIITNQHVCGGHNELVVERTDGTQAKARVLWHAQQTIYDLCFLQAESVDRETGDPISWTAAEVSEERMWAGKPVMHVGNMMSVRELISFGTLGRTDATGWNEQSAYVYVGVAGPGSSGGGVFDMNGKLVGLIYSGHQVVAGSGRGFGGVRIPLGVGHILPAYMIGHLLGR